ncbi:hypothetical protein L9F63_005602, partial [Diploptera punctata]
SVVISVLLARQTCLFIILQNTYSEYKSNNILDIRCAFKIPGVAYTSVFSDQDTLHPNDFAHTQSPISKLTFI